MKVLVNFYAVFRGLAGGKSFEIELDNNATVKDLLEAIKEQVNERVYEKIIEVQKSDVPGLIILVNGKNIEHLDGLETKINENDRVDIFPPGAGG